MALNNSQVSPLNTYCVDDELLTVTFFPNGGSSPIAGSTLGPYAPVVARTGAGTYTITLSGYSPKALLCGYAVGADAAAAANTRVDVDGLATITNTTKTVVVTVTVRNGTTGALKDVAANAASFVKVSLHFKVYPGKDLTGL